jgi:NMD protein affecting ribosome stability and mRNA decay
MLRLAHTASKLCPKCGESKPLSGWTIRESGPRIGQAVAHCKACNTKAYVQRSKDDDTLYRRVQWPSKLKRKYGITVDDYYRMLAEQSGCCATCGSMTPGNRHYKRMGKPEMFHVDHCHSTGKVRGLLCNRCNRAIGYLGDNPEIADSISAYLRKSLI